MLPVFKGKKCRYFIAIQKNVTVLKKDNSPDKWRPEELAMWLEFHGLPSFSQLIIKQRVTGAKFLKLSKSKILNYGFVLRSDQEDILKASSYLKENIKSPFGNSSKPNNAPEYSPELVQSVNYSIDFQAPSELNYWEKEGRKNANILFKAYYREEIFLFLWPVATASLETIKNEICVQFEIPNSRLTYLNVAAGTTTLVTNEDIFKEIINEEVGTIKFHVEEEEKDLLALSSILYTIPDPIIVVNSLLHVLFSNEAANTIFKVSNASFLPNAIQIFPELPVDFAQYTHIQTIMKVSTGDIPVTLTVTNHRGNTFMLSIHLQGPLPNLITTNGFHKKRKRHSKQSKTQESVESKHPKKAPKPIVNSSPVVTSIPLRNLDSLDYSDSDDSLDSPATPNTCERFFVQIEEGSRSTLSRTLDQILCSSSNDKISMFLSSYKMFHTKETILEELMFFCKHYFNDETLKKSKEMDIFTNISENFAFLLELWTEMYPSDFKSSTFRNLFIQLLEVFPHHSKTNCIKLKMIKGAKTKDKKTSLVDQFTLGLISHSSPQDIANALTAKDMMIFKNLHSEEFYKCSWMKPEKHQLSPNVLALSNSFEVLTKWISQSILVDGVKARAKRIQKFISIAQRLMRQNNFHTMMAIVSGLDFVHVSRLKITWNRVSQQAKSVLEEMKMLMDSKNNFAKYRKALNAVIESGGFAIPYMPVVLRDLTYTYESISNECTLDNIEVMGKQLSPILTLQKRDFNVEEFVVKDSLLQFFITIDPNIDEEEMYQTSLRLEPITDSNRGSYPPTRVSKSVDLRVKC